MTHAAIKVKIGIRPNGHADHPNFNSLACVRESGMDWSHYVDTLGHTIWYDTKCGHADEEPDSPRGMQWAVICAPEEFVDQAVAQFPDLCFEIGTAECQTFHDERHMHRQGPVRHDTATLQALAAEAQLVDIAIKAASDASVGAASTELERLADHKAVLHEDIRKSLDPDHPRAGVGRNKKFADKVGQPLRKA